MAKDITLKTRNGETRYPKSVTDLIFENGTGKTLQTIITELRQVDSDTDTRTRMFKADVTNLDTLNKKTDIGLYNYVGNGWRGAVSINYDSADNVSQVALSSSTPSYNGNTLTWLSAQPCAMARTYQNGAWTHWEKVGAPVVNDLTTGGTDKALSAEMGKTLKEGLDALGPKIEQVIFEDSHTYNGTGNWAFSLDIAAGETLLVKNDSSIPVDFSFRTSTTYVQIATISDSNWVKVVVTEDVVAPPSYNVFVTYRGTGSATINLTIARKSLEGDISALNTKVATQETYINDLVMFQKGLYKNEGIFLDADNAFYNAVKSIIISGGGNDTYFIRLFGYYANLNAIQITVTKNKSTLVDLRDTNNVAHTGVQTHRLVKANDPSFYVDLVIDWSIFNATVYNNTKYLFSIVVDSLPSKLSGVEKDVNDVDERLDDIESSIGSETQTIGSGHPTVSTSIALEGVLLCPIKVVESACKVTSLYVRVNEAGTLTVYSGYYDQQYLFIVREQFTFNVASGANTIDVRDKNIMLKEGETLAARAEHKIYSGASAEGTDPLAETSYLYSTSGSSSNFQLTYYGAAYEYRAEFTFVVETSEAIRNEVEIKRLDEESVALRSEVSLLQSNQHTILDDNGGKYMMKVANGTIVLIPLQFGHVLCVGNSYTTHPTQNDGANNAWFGHWSMAASSKNTAWTTLLQSALRQKIGTAKTSVVFGRAYETSTTLTPTDPTSFVYWDSNDVQHSFVSDIANFSDVDCVVVFLGDNYSSDAWYDRYSPMIAQFKTWFPTAHIVCCSCTSGSKESNNAAIAQVAQEQGCAYVSMLGTRTVDNTSKLGNFVYGQDGNLHQIGDPTISSIATATWNAVANHYGDRGQVALLDVLCNALGYENNAVQYPITISGGTGLSGTTKQSSYLQGAVVSIFVEIADGATLASVTAVDGDNNSVAVTDQGETNYGRIFTFIMPASSVAVTLT